MEIWASIGSRTSASTWTAARTISFLAEVFLAQDGTEELDMTNYQGVYLIVEKGWQEIRR